MGQVHIRKSLSHSGLHAASLSPRGGGQDGVAREAFALIDGAIPRSEYNLSRPAIHVRPSEECVFFACERMPIFGFLGGFEKFWRPNWPSFGTIVDREWKLPVPPLRLSFGA